VGSSTDLTEIPLDFASSTLSLLSSQVERFVQDWDAEGLGGTPPALLKYLAEATATTPGAKRLLAIELIKVDLEYRWLHCGLRRLIEDYLIDVPELEGRLPVDLLFEEYHIRKQAGESIELEEYRKRFPDQADELGRLLGQKAQTYSSKAAVADRKYITGLQPGTTLDDFDLLIHLGQGAFASVFLARQRSMQRLVALKQLAIFG